MNMISRLFESNDIGIDLGSAKMRVWVKGEGLVLEESSMKGRGIPDLDTVEKMLCYCFAKVTIGKSRKLRVIIAVPSDITEDEKRTLEDAAHSAGASVVFLLEAGMAAAIGAGLPVVEPKGCMVVDIGASTTEFAVVSLAGIVHDKVLHVGGDEMDNAIITHLRNKYNLLAGEHDAEDIKIKIGTACEQDAEHDYEIKGLDAAEGRQLAVTINPREIREEALSGVLGQIEGVLREILVHTEPELVADIVGSGFVLTGGGALLTGLDKRLADVTGLPVRVADDPTHATIGGVGVVLNELDFLAKNARNR